MGDLTFTARGRRAREARRRAEKAERRRLEAAEALALAGGPADDSDDAADIDPYGRLPISSADGAPNSATNGLHTRPSATSTASSVTARATEGAHVGPSGSVDDAPARAEIGLVAGTQRGGELSVLIAGRACQARLSRELLQRQLTFVVGDRVHVVLADDGRRTVVDVEARRTRLARIREDRTRRSAFSRQEAVLAANVDIAVIVAAVAQPAFHPKLVDRFLVICQYGGVQPVLCLNKCDLVESPPDVSIYEQLGLPIVHTSAATGAGLDELRELVRGRIAVFTGHSGVGKSSLVNALLGDGLQVVGAVRGADGRGRHTTTWSTLLRWAEGSYVIDTPGVRSLGVWKIEPTTLAWYFPEIDAVGQSCRFSRCSHTHEPDCAVKSATETGEIPRQRYESYVRMLDG